MKATICQLHNDADALAEDWNALVAHVRAKGSHLVVLPEMPFYPWVAAGPDADPAVWAAAVEAHARWIDRFPELGAVTVVGTRPVLRGGRRLNEGFVWTPESGARGVHAKVYLPDEAGFWEASWYEPGPPEFDVVEVDGVRLGFLICTELWFLRHARAYAAQGIHCLVCPRATPLSSVDKWLAGGRTAAVVAGAFCLSSNRVGDGAPLSWGGAGWLMEPQEGRVLAVTDEVHPWTTLDLNLEHAEAAKHTYPRYVRG